MNTENITKYFILNELQYKLVESAYRQVRYLVENLLYVDVKFLEKSFDGKSELCVRLQVYTVFDKELPQLFVEKFYRHALSLSDTHKVVGDLKNVLNTLKDLMESDPTLIFFLKQTPRIVPSELKRFNAQCKAIGYDSLLDFVTTISSLRKQDKLFVVFTFSDNIYTNRSSFHVKLVGNRYAMGFKDLGTMCDTFNACGVYCRWKFRGIVPNAMIVLR